MLFYMYMYPSTHIYIYICIYTRIYLYRLIIYKYIYIYACIRVCMHICIYMHTCMYAWRRYYCRFMHLLLLLESEFGVALEFHFALEVPCRCATRASKSVSRASALPRLRRVRHDHAQRCLCTPARTTCSSRLQITWFTLSLHQADGTTENKTY